MTELADPTTPLTTVDLVVNGTPVSVRADHPHLLAALRDELDITSPKDGCSPSGQCGCCTVHIDGKAVVSCQTPLAKVAGKQVLTLEGVEPAERKAFADAFAACGGLQCGFCTPGMVMASAQLLADNPSPDEAQIREALEGNICRCTGYHNIVRAVKTAAAART